MRRQWQTTPEHHNCLGNPLYDHQESTATATATATATTTATTTTATCYPKI